MSRINIIYLLFYYIKVDHEIESYNFFTKVWDPPTRTETHEKSAESSGNYLNYFYFIYSY